MLMFYTRVITFVTALNKRYYLFNNIKYRTASSVLYDNRYTYCEDHDITAIEPHNMCLFCKGTRFIRCNQCISGCTNCNFTEMIPCPFCNSGGGTAIVWNHQYRVPV